MRREKYTKKELRSTPCVRNCGQMAFFQWWFAPCAQKKGYWYPFCKECDILFNDVTLRFVFGHEDKAVDRIMTGYRKRVEKMK